MPMIDGTGLNYFTHTVDGAVYGAWYRIVSPREIEVIGVALLETHGYAGFSPESTARSVLENCIRERSRLGAPVPSLSVVSCEEEGEEPAESSDPARKNMPSSTAIDNTNRLG